MPLRRYKEALRLKNDFPGAHNDLGNALRDIGRVEEAIAEYREAIRLDKDYALAHLNLGRALGSQGRLDEAIASFKEAIRLTPASQGMPSYTAKLTTISELRWQCRENWRGPLLRGGSDPYRFEEYSCS